MKKYLVIAGACLVFIALFTLLPVDKKMGFHRMTPECEQGSWLYHRIFEDSRPIDIAFIGTDRTMLAIQDSLLTSMLTEGGIRREVANLGFCRYGRSLHYVILKDLLKERNPWAVVIEVNMFEDHHSHYDFGQVASGSEILIPASIVDDKYFRDLFKAFGSRMAGIFQQEPPEYTGSLYGHRYSGNNPDSAHMETRARLERERTEGRATVGIYSEFLSKYPKAYLESMVDLALAKGCAVYFLYLPAFSTRDSLPQYSEFYSERGRLLIPPDSIMVPASNWSDLLRLNTKGAGELAGWLVGELRGGG